MASFAFLAGLFGYLAYSNWGLYAHHQIDSYQTVYVFLAMVRGEMPYRDFAYYFGPFSLYFQAGLLKLFGTRLEVLYASGLFWVALVATLCERLLRVLGLPWVVRFGTVVLFLSGFAFNNLHGARLFNFVMPYCHSSTHAIAFLLGGLICQFRTPRLNWGWGVCTAGVLLNRIDLGVVYLLVSLAFLWWQRERPYVYLLSALGVTLPIYAYFVWHTGLKRLLWENLLWVGHSPQVNAHQVHIFGANFSSLALASGIFLLRLGWLWWSRYCLNQGVAGMMAALLGVLLFVALVDMNYQFVDLQFWLVLCLVMLIRRRQSPRLIFLCIFSLAILVRILFGLQVNGYFFYLGLIPVLTLVACFDALFPAERTAKGLVLMAFLLTVSGRWSFLSQGVRRFQVVPVKSPQGCLWVHGSPTGMAFAQLVGDLNQMGVEGQSLLVFPDGASINFLTNTRHPLYHASLLPHVLKCYGDREMMAQIQEARPLYLVALHRAGQEFDGQNFGRDYAQQLQAWIDENYHKHRAYGPPPFEARDYEAGGAILYRRK